MKNVMYAMDTHFMGENEGPTPLEQAHMVKEAGYDDYYMTGATEDVERFRALLRASNEAALGFNAAFQVFEISQAPTEVDFERIGSVLRDLDSPTRFEIALTHGGFGKNMGEESLDEQALAWLNPIAELLDEHEIEGSLYPHFAYYLETFTDALRLAEKMDHPRMKVMFCGYHFFRVAKEKSAADLFAKAGERMNAVNLCGSRRLPNPDENINGLNPTIEPLDTGEMDNKAIVRELIRIGYAGPIGIQGYGVTAPAKEALNRSIRNLNSLLEQG